jgi:HK97 family phage prohead protease
MSKLPVKRQSDGFISIVECEHKRSDGSPMELKVAGYAIVFDSPSERMGSFTEIIKREAVDHLGDLNDLDMRFQSEHSDKALARTSNGTLRCVTDDRGVYIEAVLDHRRQDAKDLYYAIERGDITQMSFGFMIAKNGEQIEETADGYIATVTKISRLLEVSAVTFPAYRETSIEAVPEAPSVPSEPSEVETESVSGLMRSLEIKRRRV